MSERHCPECCSDDVVRSRRRGIEHLFSWVGRFPFRCLHCGVRFFAR